MVRSNPKLAKIIILTWNFFVLQKLLQVTVWHSNKLDIDGQLQEYCVVFG